MKPLNYAILKHFTKVNEACVDDVMEALKDTYSHFKAFKRNAMVEAIMTAAANGLVEESRVDMGPDNLLRVYYRAHEEGAATINRYIKD